MIELPKKEIFIALKNQQYLHLIFPKDYTTTQDIWDGFLKGNKALLAYPKGEQIENWSKYLTIYQSRYSIDESFMINDTAFNLSGQTMIDSRTKTLDENFFFKYMETLNTKGEIFLEIAMYVNTLENNGSFICAYVEKLDKILNEEEFLDKIEHMNNIIPYEFEFLDT
jgi:hypothetical protein